MSLDSELAPLKSKLILVLDDEELLLSLIKKRCNAAGADVVTATSVDAATSLFEDEIFDAVISDIRMPNKTGMDFLRGINKKKNFIPLVFVTGFADYPYDELLDLGAVGQFAKPIDFKLLFEKICTHLKPLEERYKLPDAIGFNAKWFFNQESFCGGEIENSIDLGFGGMFINSAKRFRVGERLSFKAKVRGDREISGYGTVRWAREGLNNKLSCGAGLEFDQLTKASISHLRQYIEENPVLPFVPLGRKKM